jgi:signal transduction histidine kinase
VLSQTGKRRCPGHVSSAPIGAPAQEEWDMSSAATSIVRNMNDLQTSNLFPGMALGTVTASIAHEVSQPLSGIIINASTCMRMLAADPPNIAGALEAARRTMRDGNRASDVVSRLRSLFTKKKPVTEVVDLDEIAREAIALFSGELERCRVIVSYELADDQPAVLGDRVQLQEVILNLMRNAMEAMSAVEDRARQLTIQIKRNFDGFIQLSVQDSGAGFDAQVAERLFEEFYTTKQNSMGIGLFVSRSIIESHEGRLLAANNDGPGATFSFSIPCTKKASKRKGRSREFFFDAVELA